MLKVFLLDLGTIETVQLFKLNLVNSVMRTVIKSYKPCRGGSGPIDGASASGIGKLVTWQIKSKEQ